MLTKRFVRFVLKQYLRPFLMYDLQIDQLENKGFTSLQLKSLELNPNAINTFIEDLPVRMKSGSIESLEISVSSIKLHTTVHIKDLDIVLEHKSTRTTQEQSIPQPQTSQNTDFFEEDDALFSGASEMSSRKKLADAFDTVCRSMSFKISNVRIRLEQFSTTLQKPVTLVLELPEIDVNEITQEEFISVAIHKIIKLPNDLSIFLYVFENENMDKGQRITILDAPKVSLSNLEKSYIEINASNFDTALTLKIETHLKCFRAALSPKIVRVLYELLHLEEEEEENIETEELFKSFHLGKSTLSDSTLTDVSQSDVFVDALEDTYDNVFKDCEESDDSDDSDVEFLDCDDDTPIQAPDENTEDLLFRSMMLAKSTFEERPPSGSIEFLFTIYQGTITMIYDENASLQQVFQGEWDPYNLHPPPYTVFNHMTFFFSGVALAVSKTGTDRLQCNLKCNSLGAVEYQYKLKPPVGPLSLQHLTRYWKKDDFYSTNVISFSGMSLSQFVANNQLDISITKDSKTFLIDATIGALQISFDAEILARLAPYIHLLSELSPKSPPSPKEKVPPTPERHDELDDDEEEDWNKFDFKIASVEVKYTFHKNTKRQEALAFSIEDPINIITGYCPGQSQEWSIRFNKLNGYLIRGLERTDSFLQLNSYSRANQEMVTPISITLRDPSTMQSTSGLYTSTVSTNSDHSSGEFIVEIENYGGHSNMSHAKASSVSIDPSNDQNVTLPIQTSTKYFEGELKNPQIMSELFPEFRETCKRYAYCSVNINFPYFWVDLNKSRYDLLMEFVDSFSAFTLPPSPNNNNNKNNKVAHEPATPLSSMVVNLSLLRGSTKLYEEVKVEEREIYCSFDIECADIKALYVANFMQGINSYVYSEINEFEIRTDTGNRNDIRPDKDDMENLSNDQTENISSNTRLVPKISLLSKAKYASAPGVTAPPMFASFLALLPTENTLTTKFDNIHGNYQLGVDWFERLSRFFGRASSNPNPNPEPSADWAVPFVVNYNIHNLYVLYLPWQSPGYYRGPTTKPHFSCKYNVLLNITGEGNCKITNISRIKLDTKVSEIGVYLTNRTVAEAFDKMNSIHQENVDKIGNTQTTAELFDSLGFRKIGMLGPLIPIVTIDSVKAPFVHVALSNGNRPVLKLCEDSYYAVLELQTDYNLFSLQGVNVEAFNNNPRFSEGRSHAYQPDQPEKDDRIQLRNWAMKSITANDEVPLSDEKRRQQEEFTRLMREVPIEDYSVDSNEVGECVVYEVFNHVLDQNGVPLDTNAFNVFQFNPTVPLSEPYTSPFSGFGAFDPTKPASELSFGGFDHTIPTRTTTNFVNESVSNMDGLGVFNPFSPQVDQPITLPFNDSMNPFLTPSLINDASNPFTMEKEEKKLESPVISPRTHPQPVVDLPTPSKTGFQPVSGFQPVNQPAFQPVNKAAFQPVTQPSFQPVSHSGFQPVNQSGFQPVNQSGFQPVNQSQSGFQPAAVQPVTQPTFQPATQSNFQPAFSGFQPAPHSNFQPANQSGFQPANQSGFQPANQSGFQPANQSGFQPANQSGFQPANQSGFQPANQSGFQSANQAAFQPINNQPVFQAPPPMGGFGIAEEADLHQSPFEEKNESEDEEVDAEKYIDEFFVIQESTAPRGPKIRINKDLYFENGAYSADDDYTGVLGVEVEDNYTNIQARENIFEMLSGYPPVATHFALTDFSVSICMCDGAHWASTGEDTAKKEGSEIEICLRNMRMDFYIFDDPEKIKVWRMGFAIKDVEILDKVAVSTKNKFLCYDETREHRQDKSNMVEIYLESTMDGDLPATTFRVRVLPLRLFIDQDTYTFFNRFLTAPKVPEIPVLKTFYNEISLGVIRMHIDYKSKRFNPLNLWHGETMELLNVCSMKNAKFRIPETKIRMVVGFDVLKDRLMERWTSWLARYAMALGPMNSVKNVAKGLGDFVYYPYSYYNEKGRFWQGVKKGATSCGVAFGVELLNLGTTVAAGSKVVLETTDYYLNNIRPTELQISDARPNMNNPENTREGFAQGVEKLRAATNTVQRHLIIIPLDQLRNKGVGSFFNATAHAIPIAMIRPLIAVADAVKGVTEGTATSLAGDAAVTEKALKYKHY